MRWLLIYISVAQTNTVQDTLEFETRKLCEDRAIGLLRFSASIGLKTRAICRNAETGEEFEVKLPGAADA